MNSMIDYISSMIAGGSVFLMMLTYYLNVSATAISHLFSTTTQEDMTSITEILEHDFRKAGYGVSDSVAFPVIDSSRISIRGDLDNNGTIDTVTYWLSSTPLAGHPNPAARIMYRRVGNSPVSLTTNAITLFNVRYYNAAGVQTAIKKDVQFAKVAINMECKLSYNNQTAGEYWERVIKPQNVR